MDYSPFLPETHPPASRVLFWLFMGSVAVVVLLALWSSGRLGPQGELASLCEHINIPEDARATTIDEIKHTIIVSWSDVEEVSVTLPYEPERLFEGCSSSAKRMMARVYGQAHGGGDIGEKLIQKRRAESEQTLATNCVPVSTSENVVVLRLRGKLGERGCVTARQTDSLRIENTTGFANIVRIFGPASMSTSTLLLRIPPYSSSTISRPVGDYLSTGSHRFMSDPSVAPELLVLP